MSESSSTRPTVATSASPLGEVAPDDDPLDLVGAFDDLECLGLPHVPLDRVVLDVAVAAEHLNGVGRDAHGHVGAEQLGHGSLLAERLPAVTSSRCLQV